LLGAILVSIFLYLEHFALTNYLFNSLFALLGLYLLIHANRFQLSISGFFIAIFWFWWIALSFRYYGLITLIPFVILGIAFVYALLFLLIGFFHPLLRIFLFPFISSISIFGFDWLRFEALLVDSFFGINWWQMFIVMLGLYLLKYHKFAIILPLFALHFYYVDEKSSSTILPLQTNIAQATKWDPMMLESYIQTLFNEIENAKREGYKAIIFPETFLTTYLNQNSILQNRLLEKSNQFTIIVGALYYDGMPKNSTYIFQNGKITVAHKVVLVPFGESNPLPKFLSDWVNKVFFDGATDYANADEFTTILIDEAAYTTAICYEATDKKLYKNNPQNIIALSNNGWFVPSIQPTLQKILLKTFVKQYGVTIYHSTNASQSYILERKKFGLFRN